MRPGRFASHGEKWHQQVFGPFGLALAFTASGGVGDDRAFWLGDRSGVDGHACEACGTVVLVEPPREEGREDWTCPACGETVPGKFDTCWRCQHRRPGAAW
jgi:hypothetical protein